MARLPRISLPGIPQHIIQRGNNRQAYFAFEEDFSVYAHWLNKASIKYQVAIHAWIFGGASICPLSFNYCVGVKASPQPTCLMQ